MGRRRVAVLISGRGSNMQALIAAARVPEFPAEIVRVISNVPDAGGLAHAAAAGIPTETVSHRDYKGREAFEAVLSARLMACNTELICLAGFMRLLSAGFVETWRNRVLNIHPSLLPSFPGLDTHARALAAGVRVTGCTVHFVRPAMDDGPIIVQAAVPILPDDNEAQLAARVLEAEHRAYPLALALVASGRAHVTGNVVEIEGAVRPAGTLLNPAG